MMKEEIRKILDNTKVYVNGKSKEIQEKLFSFGYGWDCGNTTEVRNTDKSFLFIYKDRDITYTNNMCYFVGQKNREISAEEILSLEITEPSYRPFKTKEECWNEMQKHKPFGWVHHRMNNFYAPIRVSIDDHLDFETFFTSYTFADRAPFGILEK